MRFRLLRDELRVPGVSFASALIIANDAMEAFEKSRPDYQDPAKLEETIQARLKQERDEIRKAIEIQLTKGIPAGRGEAESIPLLDRPGYLLRFSWEAARSFAEKVVP